MSVKKKLSIPTASIIPVQIEVRVDARDAYAESLKMILQHVADFHMTVVDIISEKYKIPVDEIMNTVTSDSRYTNMVVDPKIHHFTAALSQNQVETTVTPAPVTPAAPVTKKIIEKKIKIKPKPKPTTTTTASSLPS